MPAASFDHLIGAGEEVDRETERLAALREKLLRGIALSFQAGAHVSQPPAPEEDKAGD
jgi:hypothetical protein